MVKERRTIGDIYFVVFSHGMSEPLLFFASMAILSEYVGEEPRRAIEHLKSLRIPPEFAWYGTLEDKVTPARLDEWKVDALAALRGMLENKHDDILDSDTVYICAGFQGDGEWTSEEMSALSSGKRST